MNIEQLRAEFESWLYLDQTKYDPERMSKQEIEIAKQAYQAGRAAMQSQVKNDRTLFCDLKTDEEKSAFFLSGRGYETGVIALSIQNDVAMAYHRCAEYKKELEALQSQDREDAERYRYLRDSAHLYSHFGDIDNSGWCVMRRDHTLRRVFTYNGPELDEAIDHARRVEGEGE